MKVLFVLVNVSVLIAGTAVASEKSTSSRWVQLEKVPFVELAAAVDERLDRYTFFKEEHCRKAYYNP